MNINWVEIGAVAVAVIIMLAARSVKLANKTDLDATSDQSAISKSAMPYLEDGTDLEDLEIGEYVLESESEVIEKREVETLVDSTEELDKQWLSEHGGKIEAYYGYDGTDVKLADVMKK